MKVNVVLWCTALGLFCSLSFTACTSPTSPQKEITADAGSQEPSLREPSPEKTLEPSFGDGGSGDNAPDTPVADEPPKQQQSFPRLADAVVLKDHNPDPNVVEVKLKAVEKKVEILPGLNLTFLTYNGLLPGPTIRARVGNKVIIHFTNNLKEDTTVHWHGLRIPDKMDGTPRVQKPVKPGETFKYEFIVKDAGSYWYHPHVRSNEQIEKGLYGTLIVQEKKNIEVTRERFVVLDDILLSTEGLRKGFPDFLKTHPEIMHGRFGNYLMVNGKIGTYKTTAKVGEVERWRIVNTANARTMKLNFKGSGFKVRMIGTDGGLLQSPRDVTGPVIVAVGQRYDFEVTYLKPGKFFLESIVLTSNRTEQGYAQVDVSVADGDASKAPKLTYPKIQFPNRTSTIAKAISFSAIQDPSSPAGISWLLNGKAHWKTPMFTFTQGDTVTFRLKNLAGPEHPFHLHGQFFEVLFRNGNKANEPGLKDTALLTGRGTLTLKAYLDNPGRWMIHCHIGSHSELGMMAEILVKPKKP
jgi:FtsP/CotA-like multicopper oxidase with cupredoxin domain